MPEGWPFGVGDLARDGRRSLDGPAGLTLEGDALPRMGIDKPRAVGGWIDFV
ncbi:MAG TPA: hypothetical protein VFI46_11070 [Jiangellaceae bacterium]|nr:hypothetical protein [Jiangellaceae bacterium]